MVPADDALLKNILIDSELYFVYLTTVTSLTRTTTPSEAPSTCGLALRHLPQPRRQIERGFGRRCVDHFVSLEHLSDLIRDLNLNRFMGRIPDFVQGLDI